MPSESKMQPSMKRLREAVADGLMRAWDDGIEIEESHYGPGDDQITFSGRTSNGRRFGGRLTIDAWQEWADPR